ncbi:uncharacterized protein LOC125496714 [Beta vulgaris subsp. vulgaris]|uniref:uncharacterized protein LOC125496714 n=1 Tax=Beta vulgaris subsp. vulgaris TaxID=3555 RepID=UPI002037286D|nr:uncharacterized protein LOC125496714 [Beta vulgaris subsp. vulgaris]
MADRIFWGLTADGEYSVKSGAALLQGYGSDLPNQNGSTTYGFVIRDVVGNLLLSGANTIADNNSILVAEAWGLRVGIQGALCLGANNTTIKGDDLLVIQAIKRVCKIPWSINSLINDAADDLRKFDNYNIQHVFRESNFAVDWIAHNGHSTTNLCY